MNKEEFNIKLGQKIVRVIKTIFDPEIPVDIYELGLIYDVMINEDRDVKILMTLTTPNCPVAESMPKEVEDKVADYPAFNSCKVTIVFDPPWDKDMMSEDLMSDEAKLEIGIL